MTLFELIEYFGYFCFVYILFILFPWVLVIFRTTPIKLEEETIEEPQEKMIEDTFIIKLETSKPHGMKRKSDWLKLV